MKNYLKLIAVRKTNQPDSYSRGNAEAFRTFRVVDYWIFDEKTFPQVRALAEERRAELEREGFKRGVLSTWHRVPGLLKIGEWPRRETPKVEPLSRGRIEPVPMPTPDGEQ